METQEKHLFTNFFGSVTDKRIILNYKSGSEDLPLKQITSVGYQHKRNYIISIAALTSCVGMLIGMILGIDNLAGIEVLIILIFVFLLFLSGLAHWIGHHHIKISSGGLDRKPLKVEMSKTREGREFVEAIKKVLIN